VSADKGGHGCPRTRVSMSTDLWPLVSIPVAPMKDGLVLDGITLEIVVLEAPDLVVVAWMVNLLIRNVKIECSNFSHLKFMMLMKTNDMKYR